MHATAVTEMAGVATGAAAIRHSHRCLPVPAGLDRWLPDGGLVRGRTMACAGGAAISLALALAAPATQRGSWLALVGVPGVGPEAAAELGVALERVVRVDVGTGGATAWAERVVAALDGFELILTQTPRSVGDRVVRQVRQRLQARGGVLVDLIPEVDRRRGVGSSGAEVAMTAQPLAWTGIGAGHGHLRARRVAVTVSGRRAPRPVRFEAWLPGPSGGFELIDPGPHADGTHSE